MPERRCVCGRSERFPLCDGSHRGQWSCSTPAPEVEVAVIAAHHLSMVGERLAHELGGVAMQTVRHPTRAVRAVVLSDGTELDRLLQSVARVDAQERIAIVVDGAAALVGRALPDWSVRLARSDDASGLWGAVWEAMSAMPVEVPILRSAFVSHAVADEPQLQPVLDGVRRAGAELFLCADSIELGTDWRARIEHALASSERFVFVVSEHSVRSTYCAFEAGFALARGRTPRLISLDGTLPPAFLAHLQAADIPRMVHRQPWLTPSEALMQALVDAIS